MDKTSTLSGITIGGAATGTVAKEIKNTSETVTEITTVFIKTDLLSLMQYTAYIISIIVGILTIISWCRKNSREKRAKRGE